MITEPTATESDSLEPTSKKSALVPDLPSQIPLQMAVIKHISMSTTKLTMTLKLVSFSILDRLEGVAPPLSMILESAPV